MFAALSLWIYVVMNSVFKDAFVMELPSRPTRRRLKVLIRMTGLWQIVVGLMVGITIGNWISPISLFVVGTGMIIVGPRVFIPKSFDRSQ